MTDEARCDVVFLTDTMAVDRRRVETIVAWSDRTTEPPETCEVRWRQSEVRIGLMSGQYLSVCSETESVRELMMRIRHELGWP